MNRLRFGLLPALAGIAGCYNDPPPAPETVARIDHIIVGAAELEAGIDRIERLTGVRPAEGGSHPGRGTRNALMSLGDGTYLELLAPDPAQSVDNDDVRLLKSLTRLSPIGWAVSGSSEAGLRSALRGRDVQLSPSQPGSRTKPDGSTLLWVTFGYQSAADDFAPFFIVWDDPAVHPSRTSPRGCKLGGMEIHHPDAKQLGEAIAPLGLSVAMTQAASRRMIIRLRCGRGGVFLG